MTSLRRCVAQLASLLYGLQSAFGSRCPKMNCVVVIGSVSIVLHLSFVVLRLGRDYQIINEVRIEGRIFHSGG